MELIRHNDAENTIICGHQFHWSPSMGSFLLGHPLTGIRFGRFGSLDLRFFLHFITNVARSLNLGPRYKQT
jgi:hypothetical protein